MLASATPIPATVHESTLTQSDAELRSHVERVLAPTYELEREIGRGGMGIVFLARDARLKRNVAIKLLPPELAFRSEIRSRFLREAETAAQLSHPSIVPIYSVDEKQGLVYFVMAYVDGENLARRIHDHGPVPPREARKILREVADALAYAHDRGVVHRDVKPDNILLETQTGRPMVTDFGIARAISDGVDARMTATGIAIGTPAFMSPEQSAGDRALDGRSDLYSLGVVAYQMLCGDLPFVANNTPALLVKHLAEAPVPIELRGSHVPADLARAVMLCLEKSPGDRFPSAKAMVEALDSGNVPVRPVRVPAAQVSATPALMDERYLGRQASAAALPAHDGPGSYLATEDGYAAATPDEISRWNDPHVDRFRRQFAPFFWVTAFFMLMLVVGGPNLLWISAFWGISIAYKYARLWSDGYDWHDVGRIPRERLFWDALSDWFAHDIQSLWSREKRIAARARRRREVSQFNQAQGDRARGGTGSVGRGAMRTGASDLAVHSPGPHGALARQAFVDRDEILRLMESLPKHDQRRMTNVPATAQQLADAVVAMAARLAEIDRSGKTEPPARAIDVEINALESQANPLDTTGSEERVRRLAVLRRQRRSLTELDRKRTELTRKLDECAELLQHLKFDMLRLRTGDESWQHMTTIAEQAAQVAREVDSAVYVADELRRVTSRPADGGAGGGASPASNPGS